MLYPIPAELTFGLSSDQLETRQKQWESIISQNPFRDLWLDDGELKRAMEWMEIDQPIQASLLDAAKIIRQQNDQQNKFLYYRYLLQTPLQLKENPVGTWPQYEEEALSLLYPLIYISLLPEVRELNASRGIPERISKDTLQDLALWLEHHRKTKGIYTLGPTVAWLQHHFTGKIFRLGRLQYLIDQFSLPARVLQSKRTGERFISWSEGKTYLLAVGQIGSECAPLKETECDILFQQGDGIPSFHIPAIGPLLKEACQESLENSKVFFDTHFPEYRWKGMFSHSWLFDPQLGESLPDSNMAHFQKLFEIYDFPGANSNQTFERVFGSPERPAPSTIPQTTLQKLILDRMKEGTEWKMRGAFWFR